MDEIREEDFFPVRDQRLLKVWDRDVPEKGMIEASLYGKGE
ncbi:MAG: hypothetical protein QGG48_04225 [Desulfatiglandales bacterium]|jgi:hypothetical protein|nr:hypothetical protein [Desulfatiglandales bacterium]